MRRVPPAPTGTPCRDSEHQGIEVPRHRRGRAHHPVGDRGLPTFQTGTITFKGLGGIQIVAGAKESSGNHRRRRAVGAPRWVQQRVPAFQGLTEPSSRRGPFENRLPRESRALGRTGRYDAERA
jgi:hypothetical protein